MEKVTFENTMVAFKRRQPFIPFVVEMQDGTALVVDRPSIVIGGGGATFITADFDFVDIPGENVLSVCRYALKR